MNEAGIEIEFGGARLRCLAERALWWPDEGMLVVSDLHLGKSERMARRSGALVPPYESAETLARLADLVARLDPSEVLCLGDSFDDLRAADALDADACQTIRRLVSQRRWIWVQGNHDPGPAAAFGGAHAKMLRRAGLLLRHAAAPGETAPEISGHYHPKAGLRGLRRPAFVTDGARLILPAFGTYTGGLDATDPAIAGLMGPGARAILAGPTQATLPLAACMPRAPSGPPWRWSRRFG